MHITLSRACTLKNLKKSKSIQICYKFAPKQPSRTGTSNLHVCVYRVPDLSWFSLFCNTSIQCYEWAWLNYQSNAGLNILSDWYGSISISSSIPTCGPVLLNIHQKLNISYIPCNWDWLKLCILTIFHVSWPVWTSHCRTEWSHEAEYIVLRSGQTMEDTDCECPTSVEAATPCSQPEDSWWCQK